MNINDMIHKKCSEAEIEELKKKYYIKDNTAAPIEICQYDLAGNYIMTWPSINMIVKSKHYTHDSNIKMCINHIQCKAHGFIWIRDSELKSNPPAKIIPPVGSNWDVKDIIINTNCETDE